MLPPGIAQKCAQERGVASMVTYDGLFQYTIVLLTLILVILALVKRKK